MMGMAGFGLVNWGLEGRKGRGRGKGDLRLGGEGEEWVRRGG